MFCQLTDETFCTLVQQGIDYELSKKLKHILTSTNNKSMSLDICSKLSRVIYSKA